MPSFASILNPGQGIPNPQAIQVYYTTSTRHLGIQLRDGATDNDRLHPNFCSTTAQPVGVIVNPSQLTSTRMAGMNAVFGFTEQTGSKTLVDISLVSPVFQKIRSTEYINKTISSSFSSQKTWIYYLKGTDQSTISISELEVGPRIGNILNVAEDLVGEEPTGEAPTGEAPVDAPGVGGLKLVILDVDNVRLGSSLAAYFDPDANRRYIIYQHKQPRSGENKNLYEWDITAATGKRIDTGSTAIKTSIAVVYWNRKVYLYYVDESHDLRTIIKTSGVWGTSAVVPGVPKVNETSQISALYTSNGGNAIHVFYSDSDSEESTVHLRLPV
ncbi:hypothetical protein F5X97DRAFT_323172 [Nemania serpens]|nr:hypothetical protein F5X97DRAFT_323172 [Nemania serpens]